MDLQITTLCEHAADYQGKLVIVGTFDTMMSPQYPARLEKWVLALRLSADREEEGEHELGIRFVGGPDDKDLFDPIQTNLQVSIGEQSLPFITRNIIVMLDEVVLPGSGIYRLEITIDGELKSHLRFAAVEVRQGTEEAEVETAEKPAVKKKAKRKQKKD